MENQTLQIPTQGGDINSDVTTWALPDGAIARLGRGAVMDIALSPNGNTLAVGSHIGLWLYDVDSKVPIALWDTERGMVRAVAFSPSGHLLATGNRDGGIKVCPSFSPCWCALNGNWNCSSYPGYTETTSI